MSGEEDSDEDLRAIERQWQEAKAAAIAKRKKRQAERQAEASTSTSSSDSDTDVHADTSQQNTGNNVTVVDDEVAVLEKDNSSPVTLTPAAAKRNKCNKPTSSSKKKKKNKSSPVREPIKEPQCAAIYSKNNCKKCLFRMCLGLMSEGDNPRPIGDIDLEPFCSMKNKQKAKNTNEELFEEVCRRCKVLGLEEPKAKNWKYKQLKQWLLDHPIVNETDVKCLREHFQQYYVALCNYNAQKEEEKSTKRVQWRNAKPCYRLYHCAAHDDCKAALVTLLRAKDHQELDARNSENRPLAYYEIVAKLFNKRDLVFWTLARPNLHSDFATSIMVAWEDWFGEITPEECKERLGCSNAQLEKLVADWDKSGKGHGSLSEEAENLLQQEEEEEEGDSSESEDVVNGVKLPKNYGRRMSMEGADNRANFLKGMAVHVLYYWELLDRQDIIVKALASMSKSASSSSRDPARLTNEAKGRNNKSKDTAADEAAKSVGFAMNNLALDTCTQNLTTHRKQLLDLTLERLRAPVDQRTLYDEPIQQLKTTVSELEERQKELREQLKQSMNNSNQSNASTIISIS